ncbi:MAG: hypothetical protein OXP73_06035 [Chloroflexota bacterium]|nr:hypothetical protein [Chloroflexota bacterium]
MTHRGPPDPNEMAFRIVQAAVVAGRKGGQARAKALTAAERTAIAQQAAAKRWEQQPSA